MATNSWRTPGLTQPIQTDIPNLQSKLVALATQNPTSIPDIPNGAKRWVESRNGVWQFQIYKGASWSPVTKIGHDADKVDGYHATITPNANTIAVRGADKKLQGDITGNAATASSAATLSTTLPVNKGGTGATTSAAARTNLGVPPTSHASSAATYGVATDTNYGHVRSDGTTTKMAAGRVVVKDVAIGGDTADLASKRGQIGGVFYDLSIDDFNDATDAGHYFLYSNTVAAAANSPSTLGGFLAVEAVSNKTWVRQMYFVYNTNLVYTRCKSGSSWSGWNQIITNAITATTSAYGLTKLTSVVNSTLETVAATPKAVKIAYDKAVAAANAAAAIDIATTSKAGIIKPSTGLTIDTAGALKVALNNTVTSTSTTAAATANAVKVAYDKAVAAYNKANSATAKAYITVVWHSGANWYRKWSDGFIEQGGRIVAKASVMTPITLNLAFTTTIYTVDVVKEKRTNYKDDWAPWDGPINIGALTKTAFHINTGKDYGPEFYFHWRAAGY